MNTVFYQNLNGEPGTFIGLLHEEGILDSEKFREFLSAVKSMVGDGSMNAGASAGQAATLQGLFRIISHVHLLFIAHFDPDDLSTIKGFPFLYQGYIDRLNTCMNAALSQDMSAFDRFEDEFGGFLDFQAIS